MKDILQLLGVGKPAPVAAPTVQATSTPTGGHRPTRFDDLIGQTNQIEYLRIKVQSARNTRTPMKHTLLLGSSGCGKTTIAQAIANELGTRCFSFFAPQVVSFADFERSLTEARRGDVIFIDEIHDLSKDMQQKWYEILEDQKATTISAGGQIQVTRFAEFTVIGATTHEGMLSDPFRNRFPNKIQLRPYTVAELGEIVMRSAMRQWNWNIPVSIAETVGELSQGTPRIANNILGSLREVAMAERGKLPETEAEAAKMLRRVVLLEGFCPIFGLGAQYRRILSILEKANGNPVGVITLASKSGIQRVTIEEAIEPFLIRDDLRWMNYEGEEFIGSLADKAPKGRYITANGRAYLKACRDLQRLGGFMADETI